jgi:hypothetical protein
MKDRKPHKIAVKDFESGDEVTMPHFAFRRTWQAVMWCAEANTALHKTGCHQWQFIIQTAEAA